jgi:polysaccharide biosynthesis transport protein
MKSPSPSESSLATVLQKLGQPAPSSGNEDSGKGEATWSLSQLLDTLKRKVVIIGASSLVLAGLMGVRTAKDVPLFVASFRLLVEPVTQKTQVADQLTDVPPPPSSDKGLDYSTQIEVLYSPKLLNPILKNVNERYPGSTIDEIGPRLSVARLGETKIIEVTFQDSNPDKVQLVLQDLARGYLEYSREEQQAQLKQGLKFVAKELPKIQNRVNSLQKQLEQLRQQFNFVDPQSFSDDLAKQLGSVAQQRQILQSDIAAMQSQREALTQQLGKTVALSQSSRYQEVQQQFQVLERQIAIEAARFGPNSPNIQLLKRQQENLVPILLKEAEQSVGDQLAKVENDLQALLARDQSMGKVYDQLSQQYRQMPQVLRQYNEMQRELNIATESLNRFLQTRDNLQIQAAKNDVPWQLLSEPKNLKLKPGSNPVKSMLSGAVMGAILGILVAFIIEKLENTYYLVDDLKRKVKITVLGTIPLYEDLRDGLPGVYVVDLRALGTMSYSLTEAAISLKQQIKESLQLPQSGTERPPLSQRVETALQQYPAASDMAVNLENIKVYSPAAAAVTPSGEQEHWLHEYGAYSFMESFRTLYTHLPQADGRSHRSLVISSALTSEGRTTIAIHLAQAAAAMGQRVLLVDAHLRRGSTQVYALLGLSEHIGLSDYLLGTASLTEAIQRLSWESNLFVMAAGAAPPDPTRLLASEKMDLLIPQLQQVFDLVIYDMPPLMGLADVKLIAAKTNGLILVSRLGKRGSAGALANTIERLQMAQVPIMGIIANGQKNYTVDLYA